MAGQSRRGPTRREVLAGLLGAPLVLGTGCSRKKPPLPPGDFVGPSVDLGHKLRDRSWARQPPPRWEDIDVVIVGGGVAGLSAAWRLTCTDKQVQAEPFERFVLLEMEKAHGGTSRSGNTRGEASSVAPYPWGAHYLPKPMKENRALVRLLREMGIVDGFDAEGEPIVDEVHLVRAPEARIWRRGYWQYGDEPYWHVNEEPQDIAQREAFSNHVKQWVEFKEEKNGKTLRAFSIPIAFASTAEPVRKLDELSMGEWLRRRGLTSQRLRWMVDYACKDDYGATADDVSAWAGLFYFASRRRPGAKESQPFLVWPEGNARLTDYMFGRIKDRVRLGQAAASITPTPQGAEVIAVDGSGKPMAGYRAKRVIFAGPQFVARYLIPGRNWDHLSAFEYSVWMVANVHLKAMPRSGGQIAWDNVMYDSKSLGYVVATHQIGHDHGPSVWTYYYPLVEGSPKDARQELLSRSWDYWAELVLSDLEKPHPEIRQLVERIDVMRWGHAMPRPRPGCIWGPERRKAAEPFPAERPCIHFAHSDLSGVGIMEEAFYQGVRAAQEVLQGLGIASASIF